jgi:hypothetical protein
MIELIKVLETRALDDHRLWVRFSNGKQGVHDFADMLAEGGVMVEPLRDPAMFRRVFLEFGAPTWPNGFDIAPGWLRREMAAAGELVPVAAE